jgi:hypothetical protein
MLSTQGLLIVAVAVAVGLAGLLIFGSGRTRRAQLKKLSAMLGLRLVPDDSELRASGLVEVLPFQGAQTRCQNILGGEVRGAQAFVFDFSVNDGQRWRLADPVVFFHPRERLPRFELRPRASSKDPRGLPFEHSPRFNEVYALTGSDEMLLRGLFQGDVLDFFERSENQSWAVVSMGEWLATAFWPLGERTRLLAPKEVLGFFEDAKEVLFVLASAAAK